MAASHLFSTPELAAAKSVARAEALRRRAGCDPKLGRALGDLILAHASPPDNAVVAGFWPLAGEIDIVPLLHALHARGHSVALPRTPKRGFPLTFHEWTPGSALSSGRFGTMHPEGPNMRPDWLLVPLLAFDRAGRRLGYGAGYYDRTLAELPGATAVGCSFAALEVAEVPADDHDVLLDIVATEREVIRRPTASAAGS